MKANTKEFVLSEEYRNNCVDLNNVVQNFILKQSKNRFFNSSLGELTIRKNFIIRILRPLIIKANYRNSTMFLTISLMDSFLAKNRINSELIPSVGIIALSLASKFNELFYIGIQGSFFYEMKDCLFVEHFPLIERIMLSTVDFNVNLITPFSFIEIFQEFSYFNNEFIYNNPILKELLLEVLFSISTEYEANKYSSLSIALSAIMSVRKLLGNKELLNHELRILTGMTESEISNSFNFCFELIHKESHLKFKILNMVNKVRLDQAKYASDPKEISNNLIFN
jgi:hypothetical protein